MKTRTVFEVVTYNWNKEGSPVDTIHNFTDQYEMFRFCDTLDDEGIEYNRFRFTDGVCTCGNTIQLDRFTNTCHKCCRDYNSFGQELAPREQWGEETGETYADIMGGYDEEELF